MLNIINLFVFLYLNSCSIIDIMKNEIDLKRRNAIKCVAGSLLFGSAVFCCACGKNTAKINQAACMRCGLCVSVCPQGAISAYGDKIKINKSKCNGCGQCKDACVYSAISI